MFGGCPLSAKKGYSAGRLELYDRDPGLQKYSAGEAAQMKLTISEASLQCKGDFCQMTCTPFDPQGAQTFELVGTLRIDGRSDKMVLTLDDIDLSVSRQFIEGSWVSIPTGEVVYQFP